MKFVICFMFLNVVLAYQSMVANGQSDWLSTDNQRNPMVRLPDGLGRFMNVNVPFFYDMMRNGSSLGLNVLSGLVKIERGDAAERNGLMGNGGRPLSVRIFGVPIFEQGVRVRPPSDSSNSRGADGEEEDSVEPVSV